ncbi:MAG TPA: protein kinase [Methanospirillum sp.]|nr:protein kinase [Methanospirillum sp.]
MMHLMGIVLVSILLGSLLITSSYADAAPNQELWGKVFGPSYVSDSIPDRLQPGRSYPVIITFRNAGFVTWESGMRRVGLVYSGSLNEVVALPSFVEIPSGSNVSPNQEVTFALTLLPVAIPGRYTLSYYVGMRSAQGDQKITEVVEKSVIIVPTDGISSPLNGSIAVESAVPGLEVFIGAESKGTVPCIIPDLPPDTYDLRIRGTDPERHVEVVVGKGSMAQVYLDTRSALLRIEQKKAGPISDGTIFAFVEANIPLALISITFFGGCIAVIVYGVRRRKRKEKMLSALEGGDDDEPLGADETDESLSERERKLLDKIHSKPPLFEALSPSSSHNSSRSGGGESPRSLPDRPMKNVRKVIREDPGKGKIPISVNGAAGATGVSKNNPGLADPGGIGLSLSKLDVKAGSAMAGISAINSTDGSISIGGILIGPGGSEEVSVEIEEPKTDEYETTISLDILTEKGFSFVKSLQVPYNRGIALLARGVVEKAYEYFLKIVREQPEELDALLHRAEILTGWGLEDEALVVLQEILIREPHHEGARRVLEGIRSRTAVLDPAQQKIEDMMDFPDFPSDISDRYTPIRILGEDNLATIILAIRNDTGDLRALKIPHMSGTVSSSFYTEVSVLYQLRHPNVLRMFRAEFKPVMFLEFEYASGIPCEDRLCKTLADVEPPLYESSAVSLIEAIASGVEHIHAKGVRHYHLAPRFILLDEPMVPKISGLIRDSLLPLKVREATTSFILAPEQTDPVRYGKMGRKTDLFQLGALWYWLMTGEVPYLGTHGSDWAKPLALLSSYDSSYIRYDPLISRLLAVEKEGRYGSAGEFLAELRGILMEESAEQDEAE